MLPALAWLFRMTDSQRPGVRYHLTDIAKGMQHVAWYILGLSDWLVALSKRVFKALSKYSGSFSVAVASFHNYFLGGAAKQELLATMRDQRPYCGSFVHADQTLGSTFKLNSIYCSH